MCSTASGKAHPLQGSIDGSLGHGLFALAPMADWTKIMLYGHAIGPATLPYELSNFAKWLYKRKGKESFSFLESINSSSGVPFDNFVSPLGITAKTSQALKSEFNLGRKKIKNQTLLAGIELVEIPNVCEIDITQIKEDIKAFKVAGVDGLSISWDLWFIPPERLDLVCSIW